MSGKEALPLSGGLEPPHDLLSAPRWPVTALDPVVEALVGSVIGSGCQARNRLDVAAQLVSDYHARGAELPDEPHEKPLGGLRVTTRLYKDIKHVAIGIYRPPQPVLYTVDRDNDLIQMPLVVWGRPIPADAGCKMRAKPIDPKANGFAADYNAALRQKILDIRRAECKAMVSPDRVGDDLARKTKALQARH